MAYADTTDVQSRLAKELTTEETTLVTTRLADVERMILRRVPDLVDEITAGTVDEEDVKQVEAEAVLRLVRNPEGLSMETDGSYTYQFSREAADNRLRILPEEWEMLGVTRSMALIVPQFTEGPVLPNAHPFTYGG